MEKKTDRKIPHPKEPGAPETARTAEKSAATLADLFLRYRREGWSDGEIEMGIAGQ